MMTQSTLIFFLFLNNKIFMGILSLCLLISGAYIIYILGKMKTQTQVYAQALEETQGLQAMQEIHQDQEKKLKDEMIAQEKMATLGSMVAGIAHEVNNPLGVSLTTISAYEDKVAKTLQAYEAHKLSKHQLESFFEFSKRTSEAVRMNIETAIFTVNGFRVLADNPVLDQVEVIGLEDFFEDLMRALNYELKKKDVKVDVTCKAPFVFYGYRGPLTQIFTNLILNSLIHGFKDMPSGRISIKAGLINGYVVIEYKDNGRGIEEAIRDKVFNMFYTSRRKEGGSGLGLHIVKTLLKERFQGTITCDDAQEGAMFTLEFPNTIKEKSD